MKVFLSWSGSLSQRVAETLRTYLPLMIQGLGTFMSKHDVESGSRWSVKLAHELEESSFGILCLTPDNLESAWLLFEAGALTKHVEGRACGLLLGSLKPTDVSGPLSQFQHRTFSKADLNALLIDINSKLINPLELSQVNLIFDKWWPDLEREYDLALKNTSGENMRTPRDPRDILEEILERIRVIERGIQPQVSTPRALRDYIEQSYNMLTPLQKHLLHDIAKATEAGERVSVAQYSSDELRDLLSTGLVRSEDGGLFIVHKTVVEYLTRYQGLNIQDKPAS